MSAPRTNKEEKKKRLGSRRYKAKQNETLEADEFNITDSASVAQHHIPEENTESLKIVSNPDLSQSDTQHQPSSEHPENRRKLGSRRINKGRQNVKDPETESCHKPTEEIEEKTRGNEGLETTHMSLAIQFEKQEELSQGREHDMSATHDSSLYSATMTDYSSEIEDAKCPEDVLKIIAKSENLETNKNEIEECKVVSDSGKLVETMMKETDKSNTLQSEEVKEDAHIDDFSDITSLSALSCPSTDQQLIDQSNLSKMPKEELFNVYSATEKDNKEKDKDTDLLPQDGNLQSTYLMSESHVESVTEFSATSEITSHPTQTEELPADEVQYDYFSTPLASQPPETSVSAAEQTDTGFNPIGNRRKLGTSRRNKGRQHVKDSVAESYHKAKDEVVESVNEAFETAKETLLLQTAAQVKSVETRLEELVKSDTHQTEKCSSQVKETTHLLGISEVNISISHTSPEVSQQLIDPPGLGEMPDEFPSVCSVIEKESKERDDTDLLSQQAVLQAGHFVSESCVNSENIDSITPEITTETREHTGPECSVEQAIVASQKEFSTNEEQNEHFNLSDTVENTDVSSGNLKNQAEFKDTQQSELPVKRFDHSATIQEVSNPDHKQNECLTKENNFEPLDQISKDYHVYGTEKPHTTDIERRDSGLSQVYEIECHVEDDIKSSAKQTSHQQKEGLFSEGEESKSSLPNLESEIHTTFGSEIQDSFMSTDEQKTDFKPTGSRRKLGSRRINKGHHHVKDSFAESYHERKEEDIENNRVNEALEATKMTLVLQTMGQEQTMQETDHDVMSVTDDSSLYSVSMPSHSSEVQNPTTTNCTEADLESLINKSENLQEANDEKEAYYEVEVLNESVEASLEAMDVSDSVQTEVREVNHSDDVLNNVHGEEEVSPKQMQKMSEVDYSSVTNDATGNSEIISVNPEIKETHQSELSAESTDDSATKLDISNPDNKHDGHTKENNSKALDQVKLDHVYDTKEPQTTEIERVDTALYEVIEGQVEDDLKPTAEQTPHQEKKEIWSLEEHTEPECSVEQVIFSSPREELSTNEERNEHYNLSEVRGAQHSEDAVNKVHEHEVKSTEMQEISQIDYSSESVAHDATENSAIISVNPICQAEFKDTHQSKLSVKSTDDSTNKQEVLNPDKYKHPTVENSFEALDQISDYHVYSTKKSQTSDTGADTELSEVSLEIQGQVEDDIKPIAEHTNHQEKEGLLSEVKEGECSLQTLQSEIHAPLDPQTQDNSLSIDEQNNTDFKSRGNRIKLGSSRRKKGRQHVKDSVAESCQRSTEVRNTLDNDSFETTKMSSTIETVIQKISMETMLEATNTPQTEDVSDQVEEDAHIGTSELTRICEHSCVTVDQQVIDQSNFTEMHDEECPHVSSATEIESNERDKDTDLLKRWGILQTNSYGSELHLMPESVEPSVTLEKTTENCSPGEDTEPEGRVNQTTLLLPEEELSTNEEQNEHFNLSEITVAQHTENAVRKVHEEDLKTTQVQEMNQINYISVKENKSSVQTLQSEVHAPLNSQPHDSSQSIKEESHTGFKPTEHRRKLGTSRRNKGRQHVPDPASETYYKLKEEVVENTWGDETSEATKVSLATDTTRQEELKQQTDPGVTPAEKIRKNINEGETTRKIPEEDTTLSQNVMDNSTTVTTDVTARSDKDYILKSSEEENKHIKETENLTLEFISYHIDNVTSRSVISDATGQEETFRVQHMEAVSYDNALLEQETDVQQTNDKIETVGDVTTTDSNTEAESSLVVQGPGQDEVGEKCEDPTEAEQRKDNEALETTKMSVVLQTMGKEELSKEIVHDIIMSVSHDSSLDPASMPGRSSDIQNSNTTNYPEAYLESLIHKSENLQKERDERETDFKEEMSVESVEATLEEIDKSDNLQGKKVRGLSHLDDAINKVHEQEVEQAQKQEMSHDYTFESVIHGTTENSDIMSINPAGQGEIKESATKQDVLNSDNKHDNLTEENNIKALHQTNQDYRVFEAVSPQTSDTERTETGSSQVNKSECQEEDDIKPTAEQTSHLEKEGLLSLVDESKSSLQTLQSELHASLDPQTQDNSVSIEEQNNTDLNPIGGRRKMGSSRRNKGRQHVKDSVAGSYHGPTEIRNTLDNDSFETTKVSSTTETVIQEISMETMLEATNTPQTEDVSDQVEEDAHLGTSELTRICVNLSSTVDQQVIDQSNFTEMHDEECPHVFSVTEIENNDRDKDTDLLKQWGILQINSYGSELHLMPEGIEPSVTLEKTTENCSPGEDTEPEARVNQATLSSPKEELSTNEEQNEHFNLSEVKEAQYTENAVRKVHEEDLKTTQVQEMNQINYSSVKENKSSVQTLQSEVHAPLDSQPHDSSQSIKEESHTGFKPTEHRRKLGSSRRNKGRQHVPDPASETYYKLKEEVVENTWGDEASEATKVSLATDTTRQEELKQQTDPGVTPAEKIRKNINEGETTRKIPEEDTTLSQNVMDNSTTVTTDVTARSDKDYILKSSEEENKHIKETENLTLLTEHSMAKMDLIQSPEGSIWKGDSETQNISYHVDNVTSRSVISDATGQEETFRVQHMEAVSYDKALLKQETDVQQTNDKIETVGDVTTTDSNTEAESSLVVQGPGQDEVGEKCEDPTEAEQRKDNEALETTKMSVVLQTMGKEELSKEIVHDIIMSVSHDSSLDPASMPGRSSDIQNSNTTNYPEAYLESLIHKSENLQKERDERETDFKEEMSVESVEATLEEIDKSDNLQGKKVRGLSHLDDAINKVHEQEVEQAQKQEMSHDYTFESVIHGTTENFEIMSVNPAGQDEIKDTPQSMMSVTSTDDSATEQDVLNSDNKHDNFTEENNIKALDQTNQDYHVNDAVSPQTSDTERTETESSQVNKSECQEEDDVKPTAEQTSHLEKEGLLSLVDESKSSLQTLQSELHASLDPQTQDNSMSTEEQNNTDLNPIGSRRKLGSSRRNKGRQHVKNSESYQRPTAEVVRNTVCNEQFETTITSLTVEAAIQEISVGSMLEARDTHQTEDVSDQVESDAHIGTSELTSICVHSSSTVDQQVNDQSNSMMRIHDEEHSHVFSITDTESNERDKDTDLLKRWEILQDYGLVKELHLKSEGIEPSVTLEKTTEKSSPGEDTEPEWPVEQAALSSPKEELSTNEEQNEHFNLSEVTVAQHTENAVRKVHEEDLKTTQVQEMNQISYISVKENKSSVQTLQSEVHAPLDSQPHDSSQSIKEESHTGFKPTEHRRKLGSSRRNKGRQHVPDPASETYYKLKEEVVENTWGDEASEATKVSLATDTTRQEELKQQTDPGVTPAEKIRKNINEGETTRKIPEEDTTLSQNVMDNSTTVTTDGSVWKGDSETQNISYHVDKVTSRSVISDATGQEETFRVQNMEAVSYDKALLEHDMDVDVSKESGIFTSVEKTHLDSSESLEEKSKEKRRKMGSTRKIQLNRKQEGEMGDRDITKQSNLNTDVDMMKLDRSGAVEELPLIVTTEVSQSRKAQPSLSTVDKKQQETNKIVSVHDEGQKLGSSTSDLHTTASNMIPGTDHLMALHPEQSASHSEDEVTPVAFVHQADVRDSERNVGEERSQLNDFTSAEMQITPVAARRNRRSINQLLPPNTEDAVDPECSTFCETAQSTQIDEQRPEAIKVIQGQALKSAEAPGVAGADLEKEKSVVRGATAEEQNASPNFNSTNRRRKMGSTRRNLGSQSKRDHLHQKQEVDNEIPETVGDFVDDLIENASGTKELQPHREHQESDSEQRKEEERVEDSHINESQLKPLVHQTAEKNPVSVSQVEETDPQVSPDHLPAKLSTSPKQDVVPESSYGGRRRKLGSHRKSRGNPNYEDQTAREDKIIDAQKGQDGLTEEGDIKTTKEHKESLVLDKISEVDESDKNLSSNISSSSRPVSEKAPKQVTPVTPHVEIRLGQESHKNLTLVGDSTGADVKSKGYNVLMVGDTSVGKTSFMKRAQSGKFSLDLPASVGLDSCMWTVVVDGKPVVLHLWDTAGQERFHSITRQIFHKAEAFLLMYDITSSKSFSAVSYWANCIQEGAAENVTILLLGNKSDRAERQVKTQDGEILAKEYNFDFMECSAATGENVIECLETMARTLSQKADTRQEAVVLKQEPQQKKRSGCC